MYNSILECRAFGWGTETMCRASELYWRVLYGFSVSAVVVSLYEDPIQPQQAASVVEKLGDYLVSCGF